MGGVGVPVWWGWGAGVYESQLFDIVRIIACVHGMGRMMMGLASTDPSIDQNQSNPICAKSISAGG